MALGKHLLGKVFISHTSVDKPFVRRLARSIHRAGFDTWLDERELVPGDRLSETIAAAVAQAKVLLVVVSKASARSKWLSYELNLASERMVAGKCRVIPIVISDEPLPNVVQGLLYADFRNSFTVGTKAVLTALRHEVKKRARAAGFWSVADQLVRSVFGGYGFVIGLGEFDPLSYDVVEVPLSTPHSGSVSAVYDKIPAYGRPVKPLSDQWWNEYVHARRDYNEELYLVVTERPVEMSAVASSEAQKRVVYRVFDKDFVDHDTGHVVFADLSPMRSDAARKRVLSVARQKLAAIAMLTRATM